MEAGRGKWLGREWVGEWRGKGDMLDILGNEYPWAAGDSIGGMFRRMDRGLKGEVFVDMWQGLTQGSPGKQNRHNFWMDFDDCFRNGRLEAWKARDPWTVRNRRRNLAQRLQGRLWGWAVVLLRRDRAEARMGIRALLKRVGGWCGAKRGFGEWERQMSQGREWDSSPLKTKQQDM